MLNTIHLRRPAMATSFECWLRGDDAEHLEAVGTAALEEVGRLERLLSRFDPAAELARVNRDAPQGPVRVEPELFAVLAECRTWWKRTEGAFDIRRYDGIRTRGGRPPFAEDVLLDEATGTVRLRGPTLSLDLGGFGKGYALDAAMQVLQEFGVRSALLHGGTSSVRTLGSGPGGEPWTIHLRNPFADGTRADLGGIALPDGGYSHSAVFGERSGPSDIVDPSTGERLAEQAACFVLAPTATAAEVGSTALLAMGRSRASDLLTSPGADSFGWRAAWIGREGVDAAVRWFSVRRGDAS
jgi:FAD:protein FMN transferase